MTADSKKVPLDTFSSAIGGLNALDLALKSQALENDANNAVRQWLPLLEAIERVCPDFDKLGFETQQSRAESIAVLAETARQVAAAVELEPIVDTAGAVDPARHEVVEIREADCAHGQVLNTIERGWTYQGRLLKRAKVVASARKKAGG